MKELEQEINRVWDIAVYVQMMAAFCNDLDFNHYKNVMLRIHKTLKESNSEELKKRLPIIERELEAIARPLKLKYPLKRDYREIAKSWNEKCKLDTEIFNNGVSIGWLEEQLDLTNYYFYDYAPYQFKVGLVVNKGFGEVEENFILKDSFTSLIKAKKGIKILDKIAKIQEQKLSSQNLDKFDTKTVQSINFLKYEVSFYSRVSIISFFSFLESFVNSIGFDHYYRNKQALGNADAETLQGKNKKGGYLNLKYKIEKFQKIIRPDGVSQIILSDDNQIKEPFKSLFREYEELRNSSVHFSPIKTKIWLKPHDWMNKSEIFSNLVIEAALQIWKSCHQTTKGPDYLGRLEYIRLYELAVTREEEIRNIENWV